MGARNEEHRNQLFHLDDVDNLTLEQVTEQFSKREFTCEPSQKKIATANDRPARARQESRLQGARREDAEVRVRRRVLFVHIQRKRRPQQRAPQKLPHLLHSREEAVQKEAGGSSCCPFGRRRYFPSAHRLNQDDTETGVSHQKARRGLGNNCFTNTFPSDDRVWIL